ncbi:MAG: ABC transporter permease [Bacteroidetes bacterium]|nr:ABC transporter permease [Bacteroidota bacterium]
MIKNYFKIAWRNLVKNKVYSFINITGLAIGFAGFTVILLYLNYELSYDTWNPSLKQVYKISEQNDADILPQTPAPLSAFLKQQLPGIEAATTMQPAGDFEILLSAGDKKVYLNGGVESDSCFFKVFPYTITEGNVTKILDKPNAIVITRDVSKKLFGNENPIGKTIKIFNAFDCEVTGVMQAPKTPSSLNVQFVHRSPYEKQNSFWGNYSYQTYVKTKRTVSIDQLEGSINRVYYNERLKKGNQSLVDFRKAGHQSGLFVDEIGKLHNFPKHGNSNFATVSILLLLAALLLLAGAINFSNLSIAAAVRRAKEIGVRKVLGSRRRQLVIQIIGEIALQCLISLSVAALLVSWILPYFNTQFNIKINPFSISDNTSSLFLQIALCLLAVILLSGLYPAIFLSRYNITKVLKGDYSNGKKGIAFRNSLIVIQFTVSAFFIISTMVISKQMHYMRNKDKGFSGEQVMRLEAMQKTRDAEFDVTRNTLLAIPGVQYVSKTTTVPGDNSLDTSTVPYKYKGQEYRMNSVKVSDDYFKTLNIPLLQGRLFNNSYADEHTRSAIINESAVKKLNLQNPIGATITFPFCDTILVQVIGVVKNFNVSGFESTVQPVVFTVGNDACMFQSGGGILLKINSKNIAQTVGAVEAAWKKIDPDFPIRYSFLDDNFQRVFASYKRLQVIINFFALTAMFISITGLFALTAFIISRRAKEIGIRKILGAGTIDLSLLLGKDFVRLVVIAVVIAIPLGWVAANKWLQGFVYRTSISWFTFLAAALIIVLIAILTMSIQTIKAAIANPVKSLRTE